MKPTFLFLFIFFLAASLPLHAQPDTIAKADSAKSTVFGSYLILPLEFPVISNGSMNAELGRLGYPGFKYPVAAVGFGLQLYTNRVITTFSYNKTTRKDDNDFFRHEVEYRATSFSFGYDLLRHYQFSLYPYVGYKGTGLNYLYQEKPQEVWSFEDYLKANTNSKEITNSQANLDLGLGWSFQTFYLLNLKAGYLVPLEKQTWKINNNKDLLRHSPQVNYKFYFTVSIGLGNITQEKQKKTRSVIQEQENETLLQQI
ncbi:hypothetical protein ACMA1I_20980 [Pontibacter sp. 13R65]|uniref:hypothetical protein n=1 Tax=Pontibacter sp. 13R65 TaxID=3127458 RepID=UPI00301CFF7F